VGLEDEIFPPGFPDRRHPDYIQTEWSQGWGYASMGFGQAADFLTQHKDDFQGALDSVGLVIFYLQRHRVELRMKELLIAHGVKAAELKTHSLVALWDRCKSVIGPDSEEWRELDEACAELIRVLDKWDRSSDAFRYPVDAEGEKHPRPHYIDPDALQGHVGDFSMMIDGYMAVSEKARRYETDMRAEFEREMREIYGEDPFGHLG
jgi:hypothetical protein